MSDLDLDLDAAVQRAQRAKTAVVQLANDLHNVHPSPHDHDYDETILAALDAVFPLVAQVRRDRADRDRQVAAAAIEWVAGYVGDPFGQLAAIARQVATGQLEVGPS